MEASFDNLSQVLEEQDAQRNRTRRKFSRPGQAVNVEFYHPEDETWKPYLVSADFAADGLSLKTVDGNGICTGNEGKRDADLEDLSFSYDCNGRLVYLCDASEQSKHFRNREAKPEWEDIGAEYEVAATEEQHGQRSCQGSRQRGQLYEYLETYEYDLSCNIKSMTHAAPKDRFVTGWMRSYFYEERSLLSEDPMPKATASAARPSAPGPNTTTAGASVEIQAKFTGAKRSVLQIAQVSGGAERLALVETTDDQDDDSILVRYQIGHNMELDDLGRLISYEEYSPFGTVVYSVMHKDVEAPRTYRFARYEHDRETGLYHCGARYYCPWLDRWTSPDPLGDVDGPNPYGYVGNDRVNMDDNTSTSKFEFRNGRRVFKLKPHGWEEDLGEIVVDAPVKWKTKSILGFAEAVRLECALFLATDPKENFKFVHEKLTKSIHETIKPAKLEREGMKSEYSLFSKTASTLVERLARIEDIAEGYATKGPLAEPADAARAMEHAVVTGKTNPKHIIAMKNVVDKLDAFTGLLKPYQLQAIEEAGVGLDGAKSDMQLRMGWADRKRHDVDKKQQEAVRRTNNIRVMTVSMSGRK
ncbi:hypothetical protein DL771_002404 [Monosporascus sp. 5C6A]|nr:hypothetical protein DL771_002404 [Monosporascus sp. 5C6A]